MSVFGMCLWNRLLLQPDHFIYLLSVHVLVSLKWVPLCCLIMHRLDGRGSAIIMKRSDASVKGTLFVSL